MTKEINLPIETVSLVVREVNGVDLIFTSDGKLLAGQTDCGHIYSQQIESNGKVERRKSFRATFLFKSKDFYGGEPLEV